jgi:hypothetical protein
MIFFCMLQDKEKMTPLLIALLFTGAGLLVIHSSVQKQAVMKQRIEYRYLPLPLDQWMKEQQFSAFNVLTDMANDANGFCTTPTPAPTMFPTEPPATAAPPAITTAPPPITTAPPTTTAPPFATTAPPF